MTGLPETIRRVRFGDLKRVLHHRCGTVLPDDDAGRDYLEELLCLATDKQMSKVVTLYAPWMLPAESERLIAHIKSMPPDMRTPSPETLGKRLNLTYAEREIVRAWQIAPCDITKAELDVLTKMKRRARNRATRRKRGAKPRDEYLADNPASRDKPWVKAGCSRPTWYRRKARRDGETGPCPSQEDSETGPIPTNINTRYHTCLTADALSNGSRATRKPTHPGSGQIH
jgi:hypothetical protein